MRILILGGTAFLSAEIARQAVAAGHTVTCPARGLAATPPEGTAWLQADRTQGKQAYEEAAGDWDAVIDVTRDRSRRGMHSKSWPPGRRALDERSPVAPCTRTTQCPARTRTRSAAAAAGAGHRLRAGELRRGQVGHRAATPQPLAGAKAHLCRAGLIGGPGDGTDRYGYWPARFARDNRAGPRPGHRRQCHPDH